MFELSEICGEIEDQELRAYAIAMTISSAGNSISESWLRLYLSTCAVNREQMDIHIAVFHGMNFLNIECDCEKDYSGCMTNKFKMHPGFRIGQSYYITNSKEYIETKRRIDALKYDLI